MERIAPVWSIGEFELDTRSGELRRGGTSITLAPQPLKLLLALTERPGQLVTREELRQRLWGEGTFVDFDGSLNFCVLQVRTALGDEAKNPRYIETLPKRGYRLIAPVLERGGKAAAFKARASASALQIGVIVLLVLAAVAAAAWRAPAPPDRLMVAVRPFDGSEALSDELITHIGRIQPKRLGVIARSSAARVREKTAGEIGRELGVQYLVEGTVRDGKIAAQLVSTADQAQLWSNSFGSAEEIAAAVARSLGLQELDASLSARDPIAHEAYLRGRQLWNRGRTPEVQAAIVELRRATERDPQFALAWIALAEATHTLAMRERIAPKVAAEEIRRASEAAVRLAPNFAQAHAVAAMHSFWYEWNFEAAEHSYRRAIELNPGEPGALHDRGWLLISRGLFEEGVRLIRRAQELDPLSPRANTHVAWAYIYTRRYDLAVREARRALELSPDFVEAYVCLERAHELAGEFDAALLARQQRQRLLNRPVDAPADARAFLIAERLRRANEAERIARDPYDVAAQLAFAGQKERALAWLAKAKETRSVSFPLAGVDPLLASLRGDRRFGELLP